MFHLISKERWKHKTNAQKNKKKMQAWKEHADKGKICKEKEFWSI